MADGAAYEIDINAIARGVDSAAMLVSQLATQLDAAGAASAAAATALAAGQAEYNQLEVAATKAAKALEKATASGKDTTKLQAEANAATAAVQAQAIALDKLKASAAAAAGQEAKLSAAMKTAQSALQSSRNKLQEGERALQDLGKKAAGPAGEWIEKLSGAAGLLSNPMTAVAVAAVSVQLAFAAVVAGAVVGIFTLAKLAVQLNKVAKVKFDNITKKAQDNFAKLFSGVHVEKFISAYEEIAGMLDESSASAKAVKEILSTMLNPLFDSIGPLVPIVKEFFKGLVIGALLVAIAVVTAKNALAKLIPPNLLADFDWLNAAVNAGIVVIFLLVAAVAILAAAFAVVAVAMAVGLMMLFALPLAIIAAIVIVGLLIYALYNLAAEGVAALSEFASSAIEYLSGMAAGAYAAGSMIIQGLLDSISSGSGMVFSALQNLGSGAMNALKSALGIASPSKYALAFGSNVTTTFTDSIESGTSDAQTAMEAMVTPPDAPTVSAKTEPGSTSNSKSMSFSGNTFIFNGVEGAEDAEARFESVLTRLIEGDVTMLGGEVPA